MAAGSSAPELATALIGVFVAKVSYTLYIYCKLRTDLLNIDSWGGSNELNLEYYVQSKLNVRRGEWIVRPFVLALTHMFLFTFRMTLG